MGAGRAAAGAVALALAAGLVTGCSGDDAPDTPEGVRESVDAPGPATPTSVAAASYATPEEVIAALGAAGLECTSPQDVGGGDLPAARRCILELEQPEDLIAVTFDSDADRATFLEQFETEPLTEGVLGEDWGVIVVQESTAQRVAGVLGGEVQ